MFPFCPTICSPVARKSRGTKTVLSASSVGGLTASARLMRRPPIGPHPSAFFM